MNDREEGRRKENNPVVGMQSKRREEKNSFFVK